MNFGSNYFNEYYHALDRDYGQVEPSDIPSAPGEPVDTSNLGPREIGTSTNPMAHQTTSFAEKIRAGASKIELSFLGQGKTDSQRPGPEAFGRRDREDIRGLADINKIRTSVHASWHGGSLAGLGKEGFSDQMRQQAITEIERAIHFASEATKGGAVVFHTGEWQRPITDVRGGFRGYPDEEKTTPIMVVDSQTGDVNAVRRDQLVFEPKFYTAAEYEKVLRRPLVGKTDSQGNTIEANDWVNMKGEAIKREWVVSKNPEEVEKLFDRVPVWNAAKTNFEVEKRNYDFFKDEAERLSKKTDKTISPEILFFKSQLADQVSQSKGQSLYYAQRYDDYKKAADEIRKALAFYNSIEKNIPEEKKWELMQQKGFRYLDINKFVLPRNLLPSEYLKEELKEAEDHMRHVHEASASADARAKQVMDRMNRVETIKNYGLSKTAETIGTLGVKAMKFTDTHRKELNEPIFIAPENWRPEEYGSHPDEIGNIVKKSRENMVQQLVKEGYGEEAARSKAKEHIKATIDVGHFNMWRKHFEAREGETSMQREKRFNKWLLKETKKLAEEGLLGHVHLTDNFGYDDEHLTPGEGNIPMKEFIKNMEEAGLDDFIAEPGSFNPNTMMADTWALMGSPIYSTAKAPTFRSVHEQHFGYHNPATYIVGAYAPSNEWRLWSEVPME
ncbi:hypothetical protein KY348_02005 [Candidatus Woesearchaeota archaeon]|nr:hypothetical protein [Candidatus Woesearchaeota archaeon]